MRVLLGLPPSKMLYSIPQLGLGYLASALRRRGHEVFLIDSIVRKLGIVDFCEALKAIRPQVLGLKVFSLDVATARQTLREAKASMPEIVTIVGGPHPSCLEADDLMNLFQEADFAFRGEGEEALPQLLSHLGEKGPEKGAIPGLVWREEGRAMANPRALVEDIDALDFPAWDLIDPRRYRVSYSFMNGALPSAPILLSRGCPYKCTFCASPLIIGSKVRKRNISSVLEEIRLLKEKFQVRTFDIVDENFLYEREYALQFCHSLLDEGVDIHWNLPYGVRVENIDREVIKAMESSGCFALSLGIESGNQAILNKARKGLNLETLREKIQIIKENSHILLQGFFILGFPDEGEEEINDTITLARRLPLDMVTFSPLRVNPGTQLYEQIKAIPGKLKKEDPWEEMDSEKVFHSYCKVSTERLNDLVRKAFLSFYFRPRVAFNLLSQVRTFHQGKIILNGLMRVFIRMGLKALRKPAS